MDDTRVHWEFIDDLDHIEAAILVWIDRRVCHISANAPCSMILRASQLQLLGTPGRDRRFPFPPAIHMGAIEAGMLPTFPGASVEALATLHLAGEVLRYGLTFSDGLISRSGLVNEPTGLADVVIEASFEDGLRCMVGEMSLPDLLLRGGRFEASVEMLSVFAGLVMGPEYRRYWHESVGVVRWAKNFVHALDVNPQLIRSLGEVIDHA